jgi:hypothetical protein
VFSAPSVGIFAVSKIYKFGNQLTAIGVGLKDYVVRPVTAPQWGVQFTVTLLYPSARYTHGARLRASPPVQGEERHAILRIV